MRIRTLACIAATLCLSNTASAQNACSNAANQRDINNCYMALYKQADTALQSTYDSLRKKLTPDGASTLREAQRAWVIYKESWCKLQTSAVQDGTMHPSMLAQCLTDITNDQLKRLTYQNTCEEDVDCAPRRE